MKHSSWRILSKSGSILAHFFVRGTGDRAGIGRYPSYIEDALKEGCVFFDIGESWDDLATIFSGDKYGTFLANEQFLYILKDHGVKEIELVTELSYTLDDGTKRLSTYLLG